MTVSPLAYSSCKRDLSTSTFTFSLPGFNSLIAVSNVLNKFSTVEMDLSAPFALSNTLSAAVNALSNAVFLSVAADVYLSVAFNSFAFPANSLSCFILLFNCLACET